MEEKILKIIYDYALNYKVPDNSFVSKVIDIIVDEKGLNDYVSKVKIISSDINDCTKIAAYFPLIKMIELYSKKIKMYLGFLLKYKNFTSDFEKNIFINATIALILLHELEHASQEKKIATNYDLEARLYSIDSEINLLTKAEGKNNELYYEYSIKERIANISSNETILRILQPLSIFIPTIIHDIEQSLNFFYKYDYYDFFFEKIENSPTLSMLNLVGEMPLLKSIELRKSLLSLKWYNAKYNKCLAKVKKRYSFQERFYLGLPITENEFSNADEYLQNQLILKI